MNARHTRLRAALDRLKEHTMSETDAEILADIRHIRERLDARDLAELPRTCCTHTPRVAMTDAGPAYLLPGVEPAPVRLDETTEQPRLF